MTLGANACIIIYTPFPYNSVICRQSVKSLTNVAEFGRRTLLSSLALLSVVEAIGKAGLRKEVGMLRLGQRGFGTKYYKCK